MKPDRISVVMSLRAPGLLGTKMVFERDEQPISFMVSKYWVTSTSSSTSFAAMPPTVCVKLSTYGREMLGDVGR